jgi:hypothetical protein
VLHTVGGLFNMMNAQRQQQEREAEAQRRRERRMGFFADQVGVCEEVE